MQITTYKSEYESAVIDLWRRCNLVRPQNNPKKDIARKMKVQPELFLIGVEGSKVVATAMGGYDGHRGWVYLLGVDPAHQKKGLGQQMMEAIEEKLRAIGCPKIDLMIRMDNPGVEKFYMKIGFKRDECFEMGKRLVED